MMRRGKLPILGCTILLCILSVLCLLLNTPEEETEQEISFRLHMDGGTEQISCLRNDEGEYTLFLPDFGDRNRIAPEEVPSGGSIVQTGDLPALFLDTASGSMDYIHMEKGVAEGGSLRIYDSDGTLSYAGDLAEIKGRGNSSWSAEKKPYSLQLAREADLLGMGAAEKWILLAEGFCSRLNLRNKIVYDFAGALGLEFTPECRWVNLYLNGSYAGLYLLSERNEVHPQRVDIPPDNGFLVSMEWDIRLEDQKYPHILTDAGQALRIYQSSLSHRELDTVWQSVENAILAEDGVDPVTGRHWLELIDLDSWARKYVLEEVFGNHDGGSFSQFFYFDGTRSDPKIHAGPIWDYDLAMGGYEVWLKDYTDYLIMNREYKEDGLYTPWFHALYEKEEFYNRVVEIYTQEVLPLMEQLLDTGYDAFVQQAASAHLADGLRWGWSPEAVQKELVYIREFLEARTEFLTDLWVRGSDYCIVQVNLGNGDVYGYLAVKPGQQLPVLPDYEELGGVGWFDAVTEEPFDITWPIYEDAQIYVRKESFQIPKIHYVPVAAFVLALPVLWALDRLRQKRMGA